MTVGLDETLKRNVLFDRIKEQDEEETIECYEEIEIYEEFGLGFEHIKKLEAKNARIWLTENVLKHAKNAEKKLIKGT